MDVRKKKVDGLLTVSVFVIILIVGLGVSFKQAFFSGKQYVWDMIHGNYDVAANKFEESYNTVFSGTNLSRNVFSFTQRLLGKHEARNFDYTWCLTPLNFYIVWLSWHFPSRLPMLYGSFY